MMRPLFWFGVGILSIAVLDGAGNARTPEPSQAPFKWCVANSAFQVEGSPADSDWFRWTHTPGKIADGTDADRVFDFWNQYEREFDQARELGVNTFRISVAWERIEPKEGTWDDAALDHYEKMILAMRARGLEPLVTLHHFALPQWLAEKGGLAAPDFPDSFAEFAEKTAARLGNGKAQVRWWLTFNEPEVLVQSGYLEGSWPPGRKSDGKGGVQALAGIARAHWKAIAKLRALPGGQGFRIGFAKHWRDFQPAGRGPLDLAAAWAAAHLFNGQILEALVQGKLALWLPGGSLIRERLALPAGVRGMDFIGINYYGRTLVGSMSHPPFFQLIPGTGPKSDLGWEIYPEGLGHVIESAKEYGLPVLVTENGIADAQDRQRGDFIASHVKALAEVRGQGASVLGYCYWSLTDNFEWARGLEPKFGLVGFDATTLERKPRPSFATFRDLIKQSGF